LEPIIDIGTFFVGIGFLVFILVMTYLIYRIFRVMIFDMDNISRKGYKYCLIEEKFIEDYAKEKGLDLDKEMLKREALNQRSKSMRANMEEEILRKMFPKEKPKKS